MLKKSFTFLTASLLLFTIAYGFFFSLVFPGTVHGASQTYLEPVFSTIQSGATTKPGDAPVSSDRIGFESADELNVAFQFCLELNQEYVSHLSSGTENPTAVFTPDNDYWERKNEELVFLRIVCDDGITSSSSEITVDVQVDVPDYTDFFQTMIVFGISAYFLFVVTFAVRMVLLYK